jgi:uncharacterized membrane protein
MLWQNVHTIVILFAIFAIPVSLIAIIIGRASRFAHRKSMLAASTVIAQYDPPGNLGPAEMGYLFDSRIGKKELVATLIDLEQRGLVKIDDDSTEGIHISKLAVESNRPLKEHELSLLNSLTNDSNLSIFTLVNTEGFKASVKRSLTEQGYLKTSFEVVGYYALRLGIAYLVVTSPLILLLTHAENFVTFIILCIFIFILVFIIGFPLFLTLALLATFLYNKMVGQPGLFSSKLKQIWPAIEGYREFVRQVELGELQFESSELKIASQDKTMPYAIALGLNTEWQKRFS